MKITNSIIAALKKLHGSAASTSVSPEMVERLKVEREERRALFDRDKPFDPEIHAPRTHDKK